MSAQEKIISAVKSLTEYPGEIHLDTHLLDDIGMDSIKLIELTVALHSQFGIDIGRKAAQMNITPVTVRDLVELAGGS